MKNTRYEPLLYSFYDLTGMEEHLEAMARKGWMLDHIGNFLWRYRRTEPKEVHFTVSYYPRASAFQPEPSEEQLTFQDFCDHAGWHLAGSYAQLQIFYNEREDPVPIDTDPLPELENLERMAKRTVPFLFLLLAVTLFQGWVLAGRVLHDLIGFFATPINLISGIIWVLLGLYSIAELSTWFCWRRRARAEAEQGNFLPVRGHHRLMKVILICAVAGVVLMVLTTGDRMFSLILTLLFLMFLALMLVVNGVRILLQKKKVPTGVNRTVTLAVDFLLAFLLTGGMTWGLIRAMDGGLIRFEPLEEMPVTVEDLLGPQQGEYITRQRQERSIFLSRTTFHQHTHFDESLPLPWLTCTEIEVRFDPLYPFCRREMLHAYDHYGDYSEGYDEDRPFYVYQPMDPAPWGVDEAFQLYAYGEAESTYLLCRENTLVELEADWLLTPEQMKEAGRLLAVSAQIAP